MKERHVHQELCPKKRTHVIHIGDVANELST